MRLVPKQHDDEELPQVLQDLFGMAKESRDQMRPTCSHVLSSRMDDGLYFCPTCHVIAAHPLWNGGGL